MLLLLSYSLDLTLVQLQTLFLSFIFILSYSPLLSHFSHTYSLFPLLQFNLIQHIIGKYLSTPTHLQTFYLSTNLQQNQYKYKYKYENKSSHINAFCYFFFFFFFRVISHNN
ncbi:hypothetical protein AAHE18_13G119000 [Arachis hypogaea]